MTSSVAARRTSSNRTHRRAGRHERSTMLFSSLRRRARVALAAAGVAGAAALVLSGCSGSSTASGSSSVTVFNGATGPIAENWNPFSPSQLQPTLGVIYEPLYYYNLASTAKPKPELATDFSWN